MSLFRSALRMGTAQKQKFQVALKQHNFYIDDMIHNPEFSDVTLVSSDDKVIEAHRVFLSSQSSFFKRIFKMKVERDIIVCLPNICHKQLESMIEKFNTKHRRNNILDVISDVMK